ncbi:MAG: HD domain-containing protein [Acholeplasmataceae bacterium]|nr:MAG: HD domain-containing protein [Acholeplasmataceae bacterium]
MKPALLTYLHEVIIPRYKAYDAAHQPDHVETIIKNAMAIAKDLPVDLEMVYVIAAYHDIGMQHGRETHHLTGARILMEDTVLDQWFDKAQKQIMKEAVEDHRASQENPPRSLYGAIIAEADRDLDPDTVIRRTVQFGLSHYPDLTFEEHYRRLVEHVKTKYGHDGYLKLWLDTDLNRQRLSDIRALLVRHRQMKAKVRHYYETFSKKV